MKITQWLKSLIHTEQREMPDMKDIVTDDMVKIHPKQSTGNTPAFARMRYSVPRHTVRRRWFARTPERNISVLVITERIAKNQVTAASVPVIRLMIFISAHTRTPQISVRTTTPFIQVHMRILTPFPLILILTAII